MFSCLSSRLRFVCSPFPFSKRFATNHKLGICMTKREEPQHGRSNFSFDEKQNNSMVDEQISEAGGQAANFSKP